MIKIKDLIVESEITPEIVNQIVQQVGLEQDIVDPSWDTFTPQICNTGFCDIFAERLKRAFPGSTAWATDYNGLDTFGHVWIEYKGKYYDAETPNGVSDWKELSWIQKAFKMARQYPEIYKL